MIKRRDESQIGNLTLDKKSFENRGQMRSVWNVLYTVGKIFSRNVKYYFHILKKLDLKKI
jgi:hypothetical protein